MNHENDFIDEINLIYPGTSVLRRFARWCIRVFVATEWIAKTSTRNLKSRASVLLEQKRQLKYFPCAIHPCSSFKHYWDCFMIVVNFIQLIITPIECGLGALPAHFPFVNSVLFQAVRFSFDLLCCCDILIRFNTGYYDDNLKEVQLDKSEIAKHYLKSDFTLDLLASIPTQWGWFYDGSDYKSKMLMASRGVALLKLLRLYIFGVYVKRISDTYRINFYVYQIVYVTFLSLLVWHIISCIIFYNIYWVGNIKLMYSKPKSGFAILRLIIFMYYRGALRTTCSAGSVPSNAEDRSAMAFILQIAQFVYCKVFLIYILAHAITVIKAKRSSTRTYIGIANQVTEFMRHKQLPVKVQKRITDYYEYHYHKEFFRESEILHTISGQLRRDIMMQKCILFTSQVEFFKGLPMYLLERIVSLLKLHTFMVNDLIIKASTEGNRMFFISSGTVAVYSPKGKEICHLNDGEYFGEVALLQNDSMRIATVVALETTEVFTLSRKDFVHTITPYPDLLDKIKRVAAERIDYTTCIDVKFDRRPKK